MSGIVIRGNKIGVQKTTPWNTATKPTTSDGIFIDEHTPPEGARDVEYDGMDFGRGMSNQQFLMGYPEQAGSLAGRFYFEGWEKFLASVFGHYDSSAPEAGVVKHKFRLDPVMATNILHTIGWEEGDEIKAVNSAVVKALEIGINNGGMRVTVEYLGDKVEEKTASWTDLSALTYVSAQDDGVFKLLNTIVKMEAEATELTDSHKIYPSNVTIRIERGFVTPPNVAGHEYSEEPVEENDPKVTIDLEFSKKDDTNKAYFADFNSQEYKKLIIQFTGPTITGKSTAYDFSLYIPKAAIDNQINIDQKTPYPVKLTLSCLEDSAIPGDMDELVPYAYLTNEIAALADYPSEADS
jgi:hypothetical protein